MRQSGKAVRTAACVAALAVLALPAGILAAEKGNGGGAGSHGDMKMDGHGTMKADGHGTMKMGDKVFQGKVGPWKGEARIMDMKAHIEASGMKVSGPLPNSHHVALDLSDADTKTQVTEGKGTLSVTGPDKNASKAEFMVMQGHFGADVNLPKPGKYSFQVEIESSGQKGNATFSYTLR